MRCLRIANAISTIMVSLLQVKLLPLKTSSTTFEHWRPTRFRFEIDDRYRQSRELELAMN